MALTLAVLKETAPHEPRVAATPETAKKLIALGFSVVVEKGAGAAASYPDSQYEAAGAKIAGSAAEAAKNAQVVICVQGQEASAKLTERGALYIGLHSPYNRPDVLKALSATGGVGLSLELVPRITRAQAMDVLSSQANLAGYRAVLEATHHYKRAMPMMMTAAGTIAPARVFVMGAGVAGLQAIATARRLGAVVSATDVRLAAKEQVQSLGASFVMIEDEETKAAETAGGYAKEMSDAYKAKQAQLIADTVTKQDIVITTALIPGRKAPILLTEANVKSMKPGSVIIDMAAEQGGNCELSKAGEAIDVNGVTVVAPRNLPGLLATDASALYSRNVLSLLNLVVKDGALAPDWEDEILKAVLLTRDGRIVHPNFAPEAAETVAAPAETKPKKTAKE